MFSPAARRALVRAKRERAKARALNYLPVLCELRDREETADCTYLDAHFCEADRLFADIARAPDPGDVEIAFELKLQLFHLPASVHGVGMKPYRDAGAERRK
jgi:hypothetical protein